jgi:hypothetical protein
MKLSRNNPYAMRQKQEAEPAATSTSPCVKDQPVLDLHRFRSGLLRAILAIKETGYGSDTQRRVQAGCGSHCAHQWPDTASGCVSDLGIGLSTLGKWVRAVSEEAKVPAQDAELLRENERLRQENRILRDLSRNRKQFGGAVEEVVSG